MHLEYAEDKTQVMTAFKHTQSLQNRPDESCFAYGQVQMKQGRKNVFFHCKGPSRSKGYFHDGYQFLPQRPEPGRSARHWNAACLYSCSTEKSQWRDAVISTQLLLSPVSKSPFERYPKRPAVILIVREEKNDSYTWISRAFGVCMPFARVVHVVNTGDNKVIFQRRVMELSLDRAPGLLSSVTQNKFPRCPLNTGAMNERRHICETCDLSPSSKAAFKRRRLGF